MENVLHDQPFRSVSGMDGKSVLRIHPDDLAARLVVDGCETTQPCHEVGEIPIVNLRHEVGFQADEQTCRLCMPYARCVRALNSVSLTPARRAIIFVMQASKLLVWSAPFF